MHQPAAEYLMLSDRIFTTHHRRRIRHSQWHRRAWRRCQWGACKSAGPAVSLRAAGRVSADSLDLGWNTNFEIRELRLPKTLPKGRCAAELHRLLLGRSWWVRFEVAIHAGAASDLSSELHSFEWSKTNSNPKSQSNKQDTAGLLPFQQSVEQQLQVAEGPSLISKPRCRRWAFPPGPSTTSPTMPFGDRRRRRPLLLAMRQDLGSVL